MNLNTENNLVVARGEGCGGMGKKGAMKKSGERKLGKARIRKMAASALSHHGWVLFTVVIPRDFGSGCFPPWGEKRWGDKRLPAEEELQNSWLTETSSLHVKASMDLCLFLFPHQQNFPTAQLGYCRDQRSSLV